MAENYKKYTQIEHVLARPGMYVGDTKCTTTEAWTIDDENKAVFKTSGEYKDQCTMSVFYSLFLF